MSVTFSYPAYAAEATESVTLPSPEEGDGLSSTFQLLTSLTRDGNFKTVVKKDNARTKYATSLDFTFLCQTDKLALEAFLINAQGEYLKYTDYNSVDWVCTITDEELEFITVGRGPVYSISITLNRWEM